MASTSTVTITMTIIAIVVVIVIVTVTVVVTAIIDTILLIGRIVIIRRVRLRRIARCTIRLLVLLLRSIRRNGILSCSIWCVIVYLEYHYYQHYSYYCSTCCYWSHSSEFDLSSS